MLAPWRMLLVKYYSSDKENSTNTRQFSQHFRTSNPNDQAWWTASKIIKKSQFLLLTCSLLHHASDWKTKVTFHSTFMGPLTFHNPSSQLHRKALDYQRLPTSIRALRMLGKLLPSSLNSRQIIPSSLLQGSQLDHRSSATCQSNIGEHWMMSNLTKRMQPLCLHMNIFASLQKQCSENKPKQ